MHRDLELAHPIERAAFAFPDSTAAGPTLPEFVKRLRRGAGTAHA